MIVSGRFPKIKEVDVVVLGGGLVGLTMALLCAKENFSVLVAEANSPKFEWANQNKDFDVRVSAIRKASENIFRSLSVWEEMVLMRVSPYHRMEVMDGLGHGEIVFDRTSVSEPNLGYIIENRVMLKALWKAAEANENIELWVNAKAVSVEEQDEFVVSHIKLENETDSYLPERVKAKLIVGADGAHSWLRETLQLPTYRGDYQQTALVATVTTEIPHEETARQRFLPTGPLAFLPLSEPHTSSIVWTLPNDTAEKMMSIDANLFKEELAAAFDYRLGNMTSVKDRKTFPLRKLYCKQTVKKRFAVIGDAAHVIHPLAGLGVNLGLEDAQCLAECLKKAQNENKDIGDYLVLRGYERSRKGTTLGVLGLMEFFKETFGAENSTIAMIRSAGLNMVNRTNWIKTKMIKAALGV